MKAPKKLKRAIGVTICAACLIGVAIAFRKPPGELAVQLKSLTPGGTMAEFTVSNSASMLIGGFCDVPQILSNGTWERWRGSHYRADFYLQPGETTNIMISIPSRANGFRVPFLWGRAKLSVFQRVAPRLHTRLSNLMHTLRTSGSTEGWHDDVGYQSVLRTSYFLVDLQNVEPSSQVSNNQPPQ